MAVYFARAESGGPVKIGHAHNPRRRLTMLQTGNPEPLRLIRVIEGDIATEAAAHEAFAARRIKGEWFSFDEEMLRHGREVAEPRKPEERALNRYLKSERGRFKHLAEAIGVFPSAISQWTKVPAERVLAVEEFTGLSRHDLRPDLFGPAPKPAKKRTGSNA